AARRAAARPQGVGRRRLGRGRTPRLPARGGGWRLCGGHVRRDEHRAAVAEWCGERVIVGRELAAAKPHGPFWLILDSVGGTALGAALAMLRSEEHTSELQSRGHLVCRLLLEKKKTTNT